MPETTTDPLLAALTVKVAISESGRIEADWGIKMLHPNSPVTGKAIWTGCLKALREWLEEEERQL